MLSTRELATLLGGDEGLIRQMRVLHDIRPDVVYRGTRGGQWSTPNAIAAMTSVALQGMGVDRRSRRLVYEALRGLTVESLEAMIDGGRRYLVALPPQAVPRLVTADEIALPDDVATTDALRLYDPRPAVIDVGAGFRAVTARIAEIVEAGEEVRRHAFAGR